MILSNYRDSVRKTTMKFTVVIMFVFVRGSLQITNGSIPKTDKPYMVYLLKSQSPRSPYHATQDPTGWTCGGVIIHPLYILTSSICVADIEQVYVISGYRKYVSADYIETDPCLANMKKRIVGHCRLEMTDYDASTFAKYYYQQPRWVIKDIATARVDTPFEFHDNRYLKYCSYKPSMVKVNYLHKYEAPGTVAMALGWGHTKHYRAVHDFKDYNSQYLMYTTTVLIDREKCVQAFTPNEESDLYKTTIKESSFCTFGPGNVDSDGVPTHFEDLWTESYNDTYKEKNSIYYSWDRRSLRIGSYSKGNKSKDHASNDQTVNSKGDGVLRINRRYYYLRTDSEEAKKKEEEDNKKKEDEDRKIKDEEIRKKKEDADKKKKEEEDRKQKEEEDRKQKEEEDRKKKEEDDKKNKEEEDKLKKAEADKKKKEDEDKKKKEDDDKKKKEEEDKLKKAEADKKKKEDEDKKTKEDTDKGKKEDEEKKNKEDEDKKKKEEEDKKNKEDKDKKKKEDEDKKKKEDEDKKKKEDEDKKKEEKDKKNEVTTTKAATPNNESTTRVAGWQGEPWAMTGKPDLGAEGTGLGNGICQNDHGGPLVTWIGGHERVIGVATAFKVTKQMECKGPFLFVSTACANQLILCTVNRKDALPGSIFFNSHNSPLQDLGLPQFGGYLPYSPRLASGLASAVRRRSMGCDEYDLLRQGLRIVEKTVSWDGHPDAPKEIVQDLNQEDYGFLDAWYG